MYCSDEVNAIVADVGTQNSRFGYSGDDSPQAVFPSVVGCIPGKVGGKKGAAGSGMDVDDRWFVGESHLRVCGSYIQLKSPWVDGRVKDWDALEQLWSYGFNDRLRLDMKGQPFISAVPSWCSAEEMAKMTEVALEKFGMGAIYLARNAVLSAFSAGLATAMVCDCGAGSTSVVPVVDGFALSKKGCVRSSRGGDWLDERMAQVLKERKVNVTLWGAKGGKGSKPASPVPNYCPALRRFFEMQIVRDLKEALCTITQLPSEDGQSTDADSSDTEAAEPYILPDGTRVSQDPPISTVADALFAASLDPAKAPKHPDEMSVSQMVYKAVEHADVDVRKELLLNLFFTGAGSLFHGASERIVDELDTMVPGAYKVKVLAAVPVERRFSVWIGGSILASCGNFHQLWLSKKEYDEMGAARAVRERFH